MPPRRKPESNSERSTWRRTHSPDDDFYYLYMKDKNGHFRRVEEVVEPITRKTRVVVHDVGCKPPPPPPPTAVSEENPGEEDMSGSEFGWCLLFLTLRLLVSTFVAVFFIVPNTIERLDDLGLIPYPLMKPFMSMGATLLHGYASAWIFSSDKENIIKIYVSGVAAWVFINIGKLMF